MRRLAVLLIVLMFACKEKPQPAETNTMGNATDRNPANGTLGTGTPAPLSTGTAATATALATAPITGTNAVAGSEVVHGAKTETTSTLVTPTTTTAAVETPTDTSATVQTMTGTKTTQKKKH